MKCLFVRPPFSGYIVDGVKFIEYRTRDTYLRGRIGIIESGTGTVIGDVELFTSRYSNKSRFYGWILRNPRRYATPVPFEQKQGAMVWIDLDIDWEKQELAPGLSQEEWDNAKRAYEKDLEKFFAERRK